MDWVIDTDMGLDDQISLLYLAKVLQQPNNTFKIKAVLTQGTGLSHAEAGKTNAVRLLRYAGIPKESLPPVGIGSENTLDGFNQYPEAWRIEEDNLRGAKIPAYSEEAQSFTQSSASLLKEILTNNKEKVSILSLGTFTTLAQVLSESPKLARKIEKIVCMAGAVNTPGNLHGALNKVAEFNAWIDPVATKVVFDSGIPITMVPLDATNHAPLTRTFLNSFHEKTKGPTAELIGYWWESALSNPVGEYFHWDPLATAIAVSNDIITCTRPTKISVDASLRKFWQPVDQPFGDTKNFDSRNWIGLPRKPLNPFSAGWTKPSSGPSGKPVNVIYKANIPLFEATMINAFADPTAISPIPMATAAPTPFGWLCNWTGQLA